MPHQTIARSFRRALLPSLLGLLCGCVTVDVPDRMAGALTNPTASNDPASFGAAMAYLQLTRGTLITRSRRIETLDAATRLGTGLGVGGAGIAGSLVKRPARAIGALLTAGATSYMINRDTAPVAIGEVYRAGLTNLECIRTAALRAHADVQSLRQEIGDPTPLIGSISQSIDRLEQGIGQVQSLDLTTDTSDLQLPIQQTLDAIKSARQSLRALRRVGTDTDADSLVGERVLTGVNGTLAIVNQQVLARTPDVEAIFQSGVIFSRFLGQGADWTSDVTTAKTKLTTALTEVQASNTDIEFTKFKERLIRDQIALRVLLNRIPDLSVDPSLDAIGQCRTVLDAIGPVTVLPNPIALTAGGDPVDVILKGRNPFVAQGLPPKVSFDPFGLTLKAGADAKAGSYTITFVDANGVKSPDAPLTIAAKAPAAADASPAPMAPPAEGGTANPDATSPPVAGGPAPTPQPTATPGPAPIKSDKK